MAGMCVRMESRRARSFWCPESALSHSLHEQLPLARLPLSHLWCEGRAGRLLHKLLVAALHRAVALAQVHHIAKLVGQHLSP
jgi:hypothetical protein